MCFHSCHCLPAYPGAPHVANRTSQINLGHGVILTHPENLYNLANRNNPDGAVLGHGACLAGEEAGWTFEKSAAETCCSGYSFNALTAQEAHMLFNLPYVSDIITGLITIGICLKSISH